MFHIMTPYPRELLVKVCPEQIEPKGNAKAHFDDKIPMTTNHFAAVMLDAPSPKLKLQKSDTDQCQFGNGIDKVIKISTSNQQTNSKQSLNHPNAQQAHPPTIISEKQQQDNRRTLIKNQLYLIEQLQLENASLRNERDQLQLENEELKFQLQIISSSNILNQHGNSFTNADPKHHQLVDSTGNCCSPTNLVNGDRTTAANNPSAITAADRFASGETITDRRSADAPGTTLASASNLDKLATTHSRQSTAHLMNGLSGDDQLRSSTVDNNDTTNGMIYKRTMSSNEIASQQMLQQSQNATARSTTSSMNRQLQTTNMTSNKSLSTTSSSLASFNAVAKSSLANLHSTASNPATIINDANQDYDDEQKRALELVCQRLKGNDSEKIISAAVIIQRAFRKYQICKRFRLITEQLRHACQSPAQIVNDQCKNNDNGDSIPYASGTTRAAAWDSLSYAASRLAASAAAATKQALQQQAVATSNTNGALSKSASSQQVNRSESSATNVNDKLQQPIRSSSATPASMTETSRISNSSDGCVSVAAQIKSSDEAVVAAALNFHQLEALRKRQYRVGLNIFNKYPEKGISFLIAHSFIDCSSPFSKSSASYYLANQLHFIDKQNLAHRQTLTAPSAKRSHGPALKINVSDQQGGRSNCQLCFEEENLKKNIAHFLLHRKGLAKEKVGQYLGNLQSQFIQDVLNYYLQELDFTGLQIDVALRKLSSTLLMPGEAQKIERFVDCFAQRYVFCQQQLKQQHQHHQQQQFVSNSKNLSEQQFNQTTLQRTETANQKQQNLNGKNKNNLTLLSRDEIFILTFAIIMLNTDLHSPSLKSTSRMSGQQFINNLRGVFKSQSISENDLLEIYQRIKMNQITSSPDHVTHVMRVQQGLVVNNFQKKDSLPNLCIPHRRLVCFCRLFEVYDVNRKERAGQHQREVFLFNDMLLITKLARRVRATAQQQYTFRQSIPLLGLHVQIFQSTYYNHGIRVRKKANDETVIIFNARNELDQSRFVDDLSESMAEVEEMENIRKSNLIDAIHCKHQERLKRHSMIHEMHSLDEKVSRFTASEDSSKIPLNESVINKELSAPKISDAKTGAEIDLTRGGPARPRPRRLKSKFSSMHDLSSVSESGDDENNLHGNRSRTSGTTNALCPKINILENIEYCAKLDDLSTQVRQTREGLDRLLVGKVKLYNNKESSSAASLHSLDSGMFLSRDVSPNQSG